MSYAKTIEYVRSEVLAQIRDIVEFWATLPNKTPDERCDGVAFSILTMIDGEMNLPAMMLVLAPHGEDRKYDESRGKNWYKPGMVINGDVMLHEEYCRKNDESAQHHLNEVHPE